MERKSDQAIYDDFEPIYNRETEQKFETLSIYLPGFKKEQLKVQVTTTRKLRVMGERPAGGANKWMRFRKEFPIPSNVDTDSIAAKFIGSNLILTLPKVQPISKKSPPIGPTPKPPLTPKENLKLPGPVVKEPEKVQPKEAEQEKETEKVQRKEKEEASEAAMKGNVCEGVKQDYRFKRAAITAGVVAPAAAVLLLSLGFYAGQMYNSY